MKSCVAFSIETGSIKWVVDGILVLDIISDALVKAKDNIPFNLTGKIVIGAGKFVSKNMALQCSTQNLPG